MKKIFLIIVSVLLVSKTGFSKQDTPELTGSYLEMKNALVKSDAVEVQKEATIACKNLKKAAEFSKKEAILKLLKKIAATTDIEKQRKIFSELSIHMWEMVKADKTGKRKLYYNYCPMKEMYWISEFETIKNPYYGSKMLNCGSIKETKN